MKRALFGSLSLTLVLSACSTASSGPPEDAGTAGSGPGSAAGAGGKAAGAGGDDAAAGSSAGGSGADAGSGGASGSEGGKSGAAGKGGSAGSTAKGGSAGAAGSSVGGAAGEAGAGGMCALVAKYSSKDASCNACAEDECCGEVNGCLGDTRCNDDYVNCQLACALLPDDEDPAAIKACFAQCGVDYPEGKQLYDDAIGCVEKQCAGICE